MLLRELLGHSCAVGFVVGGLLPGEEGGEVVVVVVAVVVVVVVVVVACPVKGRGGCDVGQAAAAEATGSFVA